MAKRSRSRFSLFGYRSLIGLLCCLLALAFLDPEFKEVILGLYGLFAGRTLLRRQEGSGPHENV